MGPLSGLTLLTGGLLAGLAVVVVPTLIHLLSRRRARRVRFAPMELLLRSQKRTARSIRLRQILLLLLRTLFFLAIAAALLRPLWLAPHEQVASSAPVAVVVVLDASASMTASLDGKSAFVRAQGKAREALTGLVDDVRTGLVVCAERPREVVMPNFDRRAVLDAIDNAEVTFAFADLGACIERAAALAHNVVDEKGQPLTGERRVVVVSDLAAHGFTGQDNAGDAHGEARVGSGLRLDLLPAFDEDAPPNHGVIDVDTGFSPQGLQVRFHAARFGGPDVEVPADLFLDGRRAARLALPFSSGKVLDRVFTAPLAAPSTEPAAYGAPPPPDEHSLTVALGDDALEADNNVELPLEERAAVRVLVVDGEPDALPLSDEVFYLSQALSSSRVGQGGKSRLALTTATPDRLDAAALVDVDVIVLANVSRLPPSAAAALVSHVQAGAGLLMTMGDQVDVDAWNRDLGALLPAVLRGPKGQALLDDVNVAEALGLTRWKHEHPLLRALGDDAPATTGYGSAKSGDLGAGTLAGLSRVRTTTTMLVEPDPQAPRLVLAHFTNDAPALLERAVGKNGEGRVLLLTTSIDREWTDLPIRPGFLPLVEQMVLYLGRALDDGRPRSVRIGEERTIQLANVAAGSELVVVDPAGKEHRVTPTQDVAAAYGNEPSARFTPAMPGLHRPLVVVDGARKLLSLERFTALLDPRESDLTRIAADQIDDVVPKGAQVRTGSFDDEPGTPLWPWLLLFGVVLLLCEGLLLRRSGSA
ncbi:MAG: BatA domain-containing protein [Deltaproteobacteria bacterium]|nr:BatA domain-containing protein [Deltaproteobacteria bacterium]